MPSRRRTKRTSKRTQEEADLDEAKAPPIKKQKIEESLTPTLINSSNIPKPKSDLIHQDEKENAEKKQQKNNSTDIDKNEDLNIFGSMSDIIEHIDEESECLVEIDEITSFLKDNCSLNFYVLHVNKKAAKTERQKNILELVVTDCTKQRIKILFWEEKAMEFGDLKQGKHYKIINFRVKRNSKNFQIFHEFYLMATLQTKIETLTDSQIAASKLPNSQLWNFHKIKNISELLETQTRCDVLAVVINVGVETPYCGMYGKMAKKREIQIIDETGACTVTLWNDQCDLNIEKNQLIAIAGAKPSSWKEVSLTNIGYIEFAPDDPLVGKIKTWFNKIFTLGDEEKIKDHVQQIEAKAILTNLGTFSDVYETIDKVRFSDIENKFVLVIGKIFNIDPYNMFYFKNNETKFKIQLTITDEYKNRIKIVAFDEIAQQIFKTTAEKVQKLQQKDPKKFASKMQELIKKQKLKIFRIQIRKNQYFGRPDVQMILSSITTLNKHLQSKIVSNVIETKKELKKPKLQKNDVELSENADEENEDDDIKK